jgi:hypothetical protein
MWGALPSYARTTAERETDDSVVLSQNCSISKVDLEEERSQQNALKDVLLRPLRLLAMGKEQKYTICCGPRSQKGYC